jgi:hypothetical protein
MIEKESLISKEELIILYDPAIAIIMPFGYYKRMLQQPNDNCMILIEKVKVELLNFYSDVITSLTLSKLKSILEDLDITSMNNSVAIYISPHFEKIIYLDVFIEECIVVIKKFNRIP